MHRRPPRPTLFPTRRSSDLAEFQWGAFAPGWVQTLLLYHPPQGQLDVSLLNEEFRTIQQHYVNPNPDALKLSQGARSEEHTSELQSQFHLVCRLLLEKKNIN